MNARHDFSTSRLLFVRTDRLGETVLNLPVVSALRQILPQAHLMLMVQEALREFLDGHPDIDELVTEPRDRGSWWWRAWRLSRAWQKRQVDVALISNPKKEYHVAAWLAGIPTRVGYDRKWGGLLTHRLPDEKALGERHEVEYNMRLLAALGLAPPSVLQLLIPINDSARHRVSQLFGELGVKATDGLVGVHPWTSNPRKQWAVDRFQALVHHLAQRAGIRPVLIGGQEERQGVCDMTDRTGASPIDVVGRLSLPELAACLQRCRVLVTNDSGPMHVAAAVGTPVVALFGTDDPGSNPRRWGPWGRGHRVIHKPLDQITVEEVVDAVEAYVG